MIPSWTVFCNGLWVAGLAVNLAVLSLALYRARSAGGLFARAWRSAFSQTGLRLALSIGLALVLVGAVLGVWLA